MSARTCAGPASLTRATPDRYGPGPRQRSAIRHARRRWLVGPGQTSPARPSVTARRLAVCCPDRDTGVASEQRQRPRAVQTTWPTCRPPDRRIAGPCPGRNRAFRPAGRSTPVPGRPTGVGTRSARRRRPLGRRTGDLASAEAGSSNAPGRLPRHADRQRKTAPRGQPGSRHPARSPDNRCDAAAAVPPRHDPSDTAL